ncbi:MAG: hypothetical protein AMS26_02525 [Bacteroides sp. SM23_62]|nr:MAG: hypothetical protein AMS26_02525 [Bacteroides sp. SM23_62]
MNRGNISHFFRNLGLLYAADFIRFQVHRIKHRKINQDFRQHNPSIKMPPDYLLYESFALNYPAYYYGGRESAKDLFNHFSKYKSRHNLNILDWGCGPGRIIRHMPELFDDSCTYYGTDYNSKSIKWCAANIPGIYFSHNALSPPLNYANDQFDIIYGISIFTHLSEEMHFAWINELFRIIKKDGIILLTTAGSAFKSLFTQSEKTRFENGNIIIRDKVREGHRTFTAFHPVGFIQRLFSNFEILEHIERDPVDNKLPQDIWIVRRRNSV